MPSCMLAGRRSLRPARSGCWRWKGRSGQPARAPAGRQPTEHGAPSAQNAGSRSAAVAARCSGEGANGQVSRRGGSPGLDEHRVAARAPAAGPRPRRRARARRPRAPRCASGGRPPARPGCPRGPRSKRGLRRGQHRARGLAARRDQRQPAGLQARVRALQQHAAVTEPQMGPRRPVRSQPPGGTRISAPTAIAAPRRTGCSAIRGRCVGDTATARAGGPHPRTCARAAGAGASATNAAATAAPTSGRACELDAHRPFQRAGRFSPKARTPSRMSSEWKLASRSSMSSRSTSGSSCPSAASSSRIDALVAAHAQRRVGGEVLGEVERHALEVGGADDLVDEPPAQRRARVDVARGEEELARARRADGVQEAPQPGVRVDEARAWRAACRAGSRRRRCAGRRPAPARGRRRSCGRAARRRSGSRSRRARRSRR